MIKLNGHCSLLILLAHYKTLGNVMMLWLIKYRYLALGSFVISVTRILTGELFGGICGFLIVLGSIKLFNALRG